MQRLVSQFALSTPEDLPETPTTRSASSLTWACTLAHFHFGSANIVDLVDPCNNLGTSLSGPQLHAVQAMFRSSLRYINAAMDQSTASQTPVDSASTLISALFPKLTQQHPDIITAVRDAVGKASVSSADVEITTTHEPESLCVQFARLKLQLNRVRAFVREEASKRDAKSSKETQSCE
jgi:hypothetical protein